MQAQEQVQEKQVRKRFIQVWKGDYVKLEDISTNAATPSTVAFENLKENVKLNLPKIEKLPEYQKVKGHEYPIALAGGGPSIKDTIDELRKFRTIIACGSSYDYLMSNGIVPTYAAICDPDPISINYYTKLHPEVKYLISSSVDKKVMEHFKDYQRVMWHCHSEDFNREEIEKLEGCTYHGISGGCTVGLRSINISCMLGYTNIHFFGFDSCLSDNECHAYQVSAEERTNFGRLYSIKLRNLDADGPAEREYTCLGYQLAQAYAFKDFYLNFGRIFSPTFHGDGLLPNLYKLIVHRLGIENDNE